MPTLLNWTWLAAMWLLMIYLAMAAWHHVLWIDRERRRRRAEKEWNGE